MDTLLPWLQELHRTQDLRVVARVLDKIDQRMLCDDPFSAEYLEMNEAIDNAHKFS